MKNLLFALVSLIFFTGYAQTTRINDFEYVIVPRKYEFQKSPNQYRINTVVKFLLEKEGFKAYFEGDLPEDLIKEPCSAVKARVENHSGLLTTKVVFSLLDCYGNTVFESGEGKSKIKEFEPSYHEAIRMAFEDLQALNYKYTPKDEVESSVEDDSEDNAVVIAPVGAAPQVVLEAEGAEEAAEVVSKAVSAETPLTVLYAQAIDNGYQLVDTTPAVRFRVRKTSRPNTFAIEGMDGLLYKNDAGNWVAEYYKDGALVTEVYEIKF